MRIKVANLVKSYETKRGLNKADFEVARGEAVAIVGHNGAGKSTLLKIMAGWIMPDEGEVLFEGIPLSERRKLVRSVGFVPEVHNLFEQFSVEYNLRLFARFFGLSFDHVEKVLRDFELEFFRKKTVQTLSKGLKQRVNFSRSMLTDPGILLLDEPTSGLDFDMTKEVHRNLKALHTLGKTILFTSHRPEEVSLLATRIIGLHQGDIVFDGTPTEYFNSNVHECLYVL